MAVALDVVTFAIGTGAATTTVVVNHNLGATPKAILFFACGSASATDATAGGSVRRMIGFSSGPSGTDRAACTLAVDGGTTTDTSRHLTASSCVAAVLNTNAEDGAASLTAWDDTTFTLTIDNQYGSVQRITAVLFGGTDITDVAVGSLTLPTSAGTFDTTDPAFTGADNEAALFIVDVRRLAESGAGGAVLAFGAATSATEQATWSGRSVDNIGSTESDHYCRYGTEVLGTLTQVSGTNNPVVRVGFDSWITNGFRLNVLETGGLAGDAHICYYLVIKGGSWTVQKGLTQTDTVTTTALTGLGTTCRGGVVVSAGFAESAADTSAVQDTISVGAFTSASARASQASWDEDETTAASGVAETAVGIEYDAVYINISGADAAEGLMDVSSLDADGATFIMDDADPAQAMFWAVLAGDTVSAASPVGQSTRLRNSIRRRRR